MPTLDFTLQTDTGETLALSSLRGRTVILYFYPKDDTSGCTIESCEFRDLFPRFQASDAVVLGISPDDMASHQKFKAKYNLPFTLLVDENHALAEQLGIWVEKTMYGNKYMGVQRTTFIVGPDGEVQHVFERVNPAGHADEVMAYLQGGVEAAQAARAAFAAAIAQPVPTPKVEAAPAVPPAALAPAQAMAPVKQATKKPAMKPAATPAKTVAKKVAKKPAKKAAKKVVKKPVKKVMKKVVKAVKKAAKKVVKKLAKKVAKKPMKKPTKKRVKKPVKKPVRKPAKKSKRPAGKK